MDSSVEAAIEQLDLGYDAIQDRLLLKLGLADNTEFAIWLTRRLTRGLWDIMQKANVALPYKSPPLPESANGSAIKPGVLPDMDFSEEYRAGRIARTPEPMLATRCQISHGKGEAVLELQSDDGKTVKVPLSRELAMALPNMLQFTTRDSGWDLHLTAQYVAVAGSTTQHVLH